MKLIYEKFIYLSKYLDQVYNIGMRAFKVSNQFFWSIQFQNGGYGAWVHLLRMDLVSGQGVYNDNL